MKQQNVLLLDLQPTSNLGGVLRRILETNDPPFGPESNINLRQESFANQMPPNNAACELISRLKPAAVFLVSPLAALRQAKSFFQSLRRETPAPPVIVVSDADAPQEIFDIVNLGAADFITPPLNAGNILPRLWRVLRQSASAESAEPFFKEVLTGFKSLIGGSPAFLLQANRIPFIAKCDAKVFISGETGTGKEMFARAIHQLSARAARPFVPLNCGAIPPDLFESELFGHERGAFTGASGKRLGLVAEAEGGTLFLDEIDSLPYYSQVKLLRFLQESEYRAVGSDKNRQANVRIITATNADVERAVKEEKLRKDLYFRLNIIELNLPPLRKRREDIALLADHFLQRYAERFDKTVTSFSPDALQKLMLYDWPGNVRELEHTVERAVALAESSVIAGEEIVIVNADEQSPLQSFQAAKKRAVEEFEKNYLQSLLTAHQGNVSHAAQAAQKDRGTLLQLLRKYGIKAENFRLNRW